MDREQVEWLQAVGVRVETFDENCGWCGKPSTYHRATDRYTHRDGSPHAACWLALSQGREQATVESVVSQRDSRASSRRPACRVSRRELRGQAFTVDVSAS